MLSISIDIYIYTSSKSSHSKLVLRLHDLIVDVDHRPENTIYEEQELNTHTVLLIKDPICGASKDKT